MKIRYRSILAAVATTTLFALPAVSQASNYQAALNSCVKAFMSSAFADKEPMKVLDIGQQSGSLLQPYIRSYSFTLTATGNTSGKRLSQATCTTDRSGSVTIESME